MMRDGLSWTHQQYEVAKVVISALQSTSSANTSLVSLTEQKMLSLFEACWLTRKTSISFSVRELGFFVIQRNKKTFLSVEYHI
jgi:hypothetical protein